MALPNDPPLSEVLPAAYKRWLGVKRTAQDWSVKAQGTRPASELISLGRVMQTDLGHLNTAAARPGIGSYANGQWGGTYDIGPDFNALVAAIQAVIDEVVALAPSVSEDASGRTDPTFSAAQMADLKTALDALAVTVE